MGRQLVVGGEVDDAGVLAPTILAGVTPDMKVWSEEVFGPVVACAAYGDLDEALRLANDTRYGLQAAIFTNNVGNAIKACPDARLRGRARQRGADVAGRPAAVRRRARQREHA